MTFRDTIKQFFITGSFPTQAQFWQLFDNIFFKDEGISRIESLGTVPVTIPEKTWIDKIGFVGTATIIVSCGTTEGGNDVFDSEEIISIGSVARDIWLPSGGTLYFTGILSNTQILIFTR